MLTRRAEAGSNQQRAELVAIQCGGMGLIVPPRPADMRGRGVIQEFFFDGVPVEPGGGGQPAGDGGAGASPGFQLAGEAFDFGTADRERGECGTPSSAAIARQPLRTIFTSNARSRPEPTVSLERLHTTSRSEHDPGGIA
jgi:hypothetical protein